MAWIAAAAAIGGGLLSSRSSSNAAQGMKYQPWSTSLPGVGNASFMNGQLNLQPGWDTIRMGNMLRPLQDQALGNYQLGQQNALGSDFLRGNYNQANMADFGSLMQLQNAVGQRTPYGGADFMSGVNGGMLGNFDPNQAASQYTNLLRQQAMPQEQQAAAEALTNLYGSGRLGTTGGMNAYQGLMNTQNQADIGRQIAGQQFGLQQQLQSQQGYDAARQAQQGLMLNQFGANQQGMMNQFGMDQGMFGRNLDLYTNSATATQDRFMRAMQLFGGENAQNQQYLSDFSGLLGAQQSQNQQLLDVGRLGAGVGQAQNTSNANAAMIRNQSNQDMIAGFMNAIGSWAQNRDK